MRKEEMLKWTVASASALLMAGALSACKGGGGGGGGHSGGAPAIGTPISGPYETVYGTACSTREATPGCTFHHDGSRIQVNDDPSYNRYGYKEDDLWFVKFDSSGHAAVYDDLGHYQYTQSISQFAGWVGGNMIGVGTSGTYWENVAGGTYWLGKNGVLYNANQYQSRFGEAINDDSASEPTDTSFASLNSDANKALVKSASENLIKEYGFTKTKATAIASALNSWAVAGAERGYTTSKDMDKTFKSVFGVDYNSALAAVKDLAEGNKASMQDLTQRSASALGLKPAQAQKFMKGMYKKALAQWGFDVDEVNW